MTMKRLASRSIVILILAFATAALAQVLDLLWFMIDGRGEKSTGGEPGEQWIQVEATKDGHQHFVRGPDREQAIINLGLLVKNADSASSAIGDLTQPTGLFSLTIASFPPEPGSG